MLLDDSSILSTSDSRSSVPPRSPMTFRLNLNEDLLSPQTRHGLLTARPMTSIGCSADSEIKDSSNIVVHVSRTVSYMVIASQVMVVLILAIMIFSMLYMFLHLNQTVNHYYEAAYPYLTELANHSLGMVRHADTSSMHLENVMAQTQVLAGTSIPDVIDSVNRTASMVSRLEHVSQNPVIKLSMA